MLLSIFFYCRPLTGGSAAPSRILSPLYFHFIYMINNDNNCYILFFAALREARTITPRVDIALLHYHTVLAWFQPPRARRIVRVERCGTQRRLGVAAMRRLGVEAHKGEGSAFREVIPGRRLARARRIAEAAAEAAGDG